MNRISQLRRTSFSACLLMASLALNSCGPNGAGNTSEGSTSPFSAGDAASICENAARDQITHPSTADFSIWGIGFKSFDDGTSMLTTTFTAKNGFDLELEYQVACEFTGSTLTDIKIEEAR